MAGRATWQARNSTTEISERLLRSHQNSVVKNSPSLVLGSTQTDFWATFSRGWPNILTTKYMMVREADHNIHIQPIAAAALQGIGGPWSPS